MKRIVAVLLGVVLMGFVVGDAAAGGGRGHFRGGHVTHSQQFKHHHFGHHRHHRAHFGFFIGAPLAFPWYYPPYAYTAPVVVAREPVVYLERNSAAPAGSDADYWYRCDSPAGYYPYVKECPGGWQKEVPHAPQR